MKCSKCNGTGFVEKICSGCKGLGNVTCGLCNGTGKGMDGKDCRGPCGGRGYIEHYACNGTGKYSEQCSKCEGTGNTDQ